MNGDAPFDYSAFVGWGGKAWENLVRRAIDDFTGHDLIGKRVLDIGARAGGMSCLFALLGAQVTAIDINGSHFEEARTRARELGVDHRIQFIEYDGDLALLKDGQFDVAFAKSVLVLMQDLEAFLRDLNRKLSEQGKIIFIENAVGRLPLRPGFFLARRYRWGDGARSFHYFGPGDVALVRRVFDVRDVRQTIVPPVYLILGQRFKNG